MKYMGSKRAMLTNGLGNLLRTEATKYERVVDLFCGAGSVAWFVCQHTKKPVLAVDLQQYAAVMAGAVVTRVKAVDAQQLITSWCKPAAAQRTRHSLWDDAIRTGDGPINTATWCGGARRLCAEQPDVGIIWSAYGGHYFSPAQALTIDTLLESLPSDAQSRTIALAALIMSASQCVASPGHTAQPFQPTRSAARFLREAWKRDPIVYVERALRLLCPQHAWASGYAQVGDALAYAQRLDESDLVFIDPPYSGVHYSRFYHVLETIARGGCGKVDGVGRYPPPAERPVSRFSRKSEAHSALDTLLQRLRDRKCAAILTFPEGECSNGLSGSSVLQATKRYFSVGTRIVSSKFSTLGGNNDVRQARQQAHEMILLLQPKSSTCQIM